MKYLILFIVIVLGVALLKKQLGGGAQQRKGGKKPDPYTSQNPETLMKTEPMLRCAHCGVFMPRSSAVLRNGRNFCSDEHADKHAH
ncbi:MAG: hypothetical protein KGJ44_02050 [Betaproteobacteria bacterium]|nr:hypothetical protein [Betaproteobacteria bacterium]MDE2047166.1 hypothetical protein [Betaproteobacteria bacterium]